MNKKSPKRTSSIQPRRRNILIASILAAVFLVILGIFIYPKFTPGSNMITPVPFERPQSQDNSMGDPNAPIKVEELADFQCSACAVFTHEVEPRLVEVYIATGKVYFTYRPFAFIGVESTNAAKASLCAMNQGKFWQYHDLLYARQTGENVGDFTPARLSEFSKELNLDNAKFDQCMQSKEIDRKVNDNNIYGRTQGLIATPSFLVNGKLVRLEGLVPQIEIELNGN